MRIGLRCAVLCSVLCCLIHRVSNPGFLNFIQQFLLIFDQTSGGSPTDLAAMAAALANSLSTGNTPLSSSAVATPRGSRSSSVGRRRTPRQHQHSRGASGSNAAAAAIQHGSGSGGSSAAMAAEVYGATNAAAAAAATAALGGSSSGRKTARGRRGAVSPSIAPLHREGVMGLTAAAAAAATAGGGAQGAEASPRRHRA